MLIDTHAHLVSLEDPDDAVQNAADAGIINIISMATGLDSCYTTIEIANKHEQVYAAVGIHPHAASSYTPDVLSKIEELTGEDKVVAVGETGLDYHYMNSPKDIQIESFSAHVDMATRTGLPFVVHVRDADEDMINILSSSSLKDNPGVIHCFSGNWETARKYLDLGFFISFSGIVTFNRAEELREAARNVPFDRILVETDSPYLAPVPHRGKPNEPANVKYVADVIAKVKDIDMPALENQLLENTKTLFSNIK